MYYFDPYEPAARISTIGALIALAAIYNFEVHQMDIYDSSRRFCDAWTKT